MLTEKVFGIDSWLVLLIHIYMLKVRGDPVAQCS